MFERFPRKIVASTIAALLAALGVGGAALAQSGGTAGSQTQAAPAAGDRDTLQQGDQTSPDTGASAKAEANGAGESATEQGGSEVPNNDGPGGHADEPGNPNANHQAQGQE